MWTKWIERVKRELEIRGWPDAELARRSGVGKATVDRLLGEHPNPQMKTVRAINAVFGWDAEGGDADIIGEKDVSGVLVSDAIIEKIPEIKGLIKIANEYANMEKWEKMFDAMDEVADAIKREKSSFQKRGLKKQSSG